MGQNMIGQDITEHYIAGLNRPEHSRTGYGKTPDSFKTNQIKTVQVTLDRSNQEGRKQILEKSETNKQIKNLNLTNGNTQTKVYKRVQ